MNERRKKRNQHQPIDAAEQKLINGGTFSLSYAVTGFSEEHFQIIVPRTLPQNYAYVAFNDLVYACLKNRLDDLHDDAEVLATTQTEWSVYRVNLLQKNRITHYEWARRHIFTDADAKFFSELGIAPVNQLTDFRLGELEALAGFVPDFVKQDNTEHDRKEREEHDRRNRMMDEMLWAPLDAQEKPPAFGTIHQLADTMIRAEENSRASFSRADVEWLLDLDVYDLDENAATMWFQHLVRERVLRGAPFALEHEKRVRAMKVGYPW